jgi:hypothetical protein
MSEQFPLRISSNQHFCMSHQAGACGIRILLEMEDRASLWICFRLTGARLPSWRRINGTRVHSASGQVGDVFLRVLAVLGIIVSRNRDKYLPPGGEDR